MKKPKTAVLVGAGGRGYLCYAMYAKHHPEQLKITAVADPDVSKRKKVAEMCGVAEQACYDDWQSLMNAGRIADAVLIATPDRLHYEPALKAIDLGYDILLEKPISPKLSEVIDMVQRAKKTDTLMMITHVLRYTDIFYRVKQLLEEGAIGTLVSVQHNENVGYFHYAHSFVRGNWRKSGLSSPMILAKSVHDMDLIRWLVDSPCTHLSSFGTLKNFKKEYAPKGAPMRCVDGCPVEAACPYSTSAYEREDTEFVWNFHSILMHGYPGMDEKEVLRQSPYGRCVYQCDNDVVDNQTVSMMFANDVTVSFIMTGFTDRISRTMKLMGTHGELRIHFSKKSIVQYNFKDRKATEHMGIAENEKVDEHGGGDERFMDCFVNTMRSRNIAPTHEVNQQCLDAHAMAMAAEYSRLHNGESINMEKFTAAI